MDFLLFHEICGKSQLGTNSAEWWIFGSCLQGEGHFWHSTSHTHAHTHVREDEPSLPKESYIVEIASGYS